MPERAPAAFLGHGSPMNALERNRYTDAWSRFGHAMGTPRAVLAVSAHWYVNTTAVTAMERPRTIHDFYGFPDELFAVEYPAPGDPGIAAEVVEVLAPIWAGLDEETWGLDHGTWSVMRHVRPEADVPVLQLSINAQQPPRHHVDVGRRLSELRDRGIAVVASGNVVHNLRLIDWSRATDGFDWAHRFDEAVRATMLERPGDVTALATHPDFALAVPTPDHFLPLLYLAGMAEESGEQVDVLVDGYAYGSLSMTCYSLGVDVGVGGSGRESAALPDPDVVPPVDTNT